MPARATLVGIVLIQFFFGVQLLREATGPGGLRPPVAALGLLYLIAGSTALWSARSRTPRAITACVIVIAILVAMTLRIFDPAGSPDPSLRSQIAWACCAPSLGAVPLSIWLGTRASRRGDSRPTGSGPA